MRSEITSKRAVSKRLSLGEMEVHASCIVVARERPFVPPIDCGEEVRHRPTHLEGGYSHIRTSTMSGEGRLGGRELLVGRDPQVLCHDLEA